MLADVQPFLKSLADLFAEGRLGEMAGHVAFPFPLQLGDDLIVLRWPAELVTTLSQHRQSRFAGGARAFVPHVSAIELPRKGRFRVWVRWEFRFPRHAVANGASATYYMHRRDDGRLTIEMADYAAMASAAVKAVAPGLRRQA